MKRIPEGQSVLSTFTFSVLEDDITSERLTCSLMGERLRAYK